MATHIPDLRRKLEALRHHGPARTPKLLAERLGVAESTMNGWVSGGSKGAPDSVPRQRMPALLNLFAEILPRDLPREAVESLVLGSVADLEAALTAGSTTTLEDILNAEARRDTASLHRPGALSLVEHDNAGGDNLHKVKLDERFFLEFRIRRGGHLLALQNAQQEWGAVKFADGALSPYAKTGSVLVPGLRNGKLIALREPHVRGSHRFILIVSPSPFPPAIIQASSGRKSLDWTMLCGLAGHYSKQPGHRREIHLLELIIS